MAFYDQDYGPYRESHTGRNIIITAILGAAVVGVWTKVLPEGAKDRLTTHHDDCGDLSPFYKDPEGVVVSCAPFVDKTTQQVERGMFTFVPQPGSLKVLGNGNYAVGAELRYEGDAAERVFGRPSLNLDQFDDVLQENEATRALCVSDMERVAEFVRENTPLFAKSTVSEFDIGNAENGYSVWPTGLNDNDPNKPELLIYDSTLNRPTQNVLVTCWTP